MPTLEVHGINLQVTASLQEYADSKVNKATENLGKWVSNVRVNLNYEARTEGHIAEIIVFIQGGKTIRSCSRTDDLYASIDIACASIERQLRKNKEKSLAKRRQASIKSSVIEAEQLEQIAA